MIVTWQHPLLLTWLETMIDSALPRPATTIALFDGSEPQAVIGFFNYDGISVEGAIAAASPRHWANRTFLKAAFAYAFNQMECRRFVVRVEESNVDALRFDLKLGFKKEGVLRQASGTGGDVILLSMLKDEWRQSKWYQPELKNGQEISTEGTESAGLQPVDRAAG